jgi:hypothetical protein
VHQARVEPVVVQHFHQPGPAVGSLECHRRAGRQLADQLQDRLAPIHHVVVELNLAVPGDDRHLRALAVHVDSHVNRHCRVSFPELVLTRGASSYRAELGRCPVLIGSDECFCNARRAAVRRS